MTLTMMTAQYFEGTARRFVPKAENTGPVVRARRFKRHSAYLPGTLHALLDRWALELYDTDRYDDPRAVWCSFYKGRMTRMYKMGKRSWKALRLGRLARLTRRLDRG